MHAPSIMRPVIEPTTPPSPPERRTAQKTKSESTKAQILAAAVAVLIEQGLSRTTTLEVQKQAAVSRGALLYHFPTHADLLSMTVKQLITLNEQAGWEEADKLKHLQDPLARSIWAIANAYRHPSFIAELELWIASRSDQNLRQALRTVERDAVADRDRVLAKLFDGQLDQPGAKQILALTTEFVRGLAVSTLLRNDTTLRDQLINDWIETVRTRAPAK